MDALCFFPDGTGTPKSIDTPNKLGLVRVPKPEVGAPDDVLVKVKYAGLCGTDIHIIQGEFPIPRVGRIVLGHEFSGEIVSLGEDVAESSRLNIGDRVAVDPNLWCRKCRFCAVGKVNLCQDLRAVGVRFLNGGFGAYCLVKADIVHVIPDTLPSELGALVEPMSCIQQGWNRLQSIPQTTDTKNRVLVIGAGIIGLLWTSLLHFKGLRQIWVSDLSKGRRDIAQSLGLCKGVVTPKEIEESSLRFDTVVDCSGSARAFEMAVKSSDRGATILVFGCAPKDAVASLRPMEVYEKELTILGSNIDPFTFPEAVSLTAAMHQTGLLELGKLGVEVFPLGEYVDALSKLKDGSISKALFRVSQD